MAKSSSFRNSIWLVVIVLWPVAMLNYLDRQMLASLKTSMFADIPSIKTDENWGLVLGVFKWVYAFASPFAGFIGDRFSRRTVILSSLVFWSLATLATGFVTSLNELFWARALMGLSEAFYIPTALAFIADYHSGETRSRAMSIHQTAIYAGNILGGFAGYAPEIPGVGWRGAFQGCGILGIAYAVPLLFLLKDPPRNSPAKALDEPRGGVWGLLNRDFVLLVLYFTLPALAGWVIRDWMPAILKERFTLNQGKAGVSAVLYVQIGSLLGAAVAGYAADRWMHVSLRGRIYVSAIGTGLLLPALIGIGYAQTLAIAVTFLMLFGIGWGFFDSNNMPILCQITPQAYRATGYGIMNLVSISCGGVADWKFGALLDRNVSVGTIFSVFAGLAMISVWLVLSIRPRPELAQKTS